MRGFIWGNATLLVLLGVSLSFPVVRIEVAKVLEGASQVLYQSVEKNQFDFWLAIALLFIIMAIQLAISLHFIRTASRSISSRVGKRLRLRNIPKCF